MRVFGRMVVLGVGEVLIGVKWCVADYCGHLSREIRVICIMAIGHQWLSLPKEK